MKNRRDYYRILHVQPDAPREVIRSSYRAMMQKMRLHPDLGGDGSRAAIINEAYATLTNAKNRAAYDRTRQHRERPRSPQKPREESADSPATALQRCPFCGVMNEWDKNVSAAPLCSNCQSPLLLPRQSQLEDDDRRAITRVPHDHPLIFCTHWPQTEPGSGHTADVSLQGMKFRSRVDLPLGQIIRIDTQILRAVARVTRSQREFSDWVVGVQFISLCFERSLGSFITERA